MEEYCTPRREFVLFSPEIRVLVDRSKQLDPEVSDLRKFIRDGTDVDDSRLSTRAAGQPITSFAYAKNDVLVTALLVNGTIYRYMLVVQGPRLYYPFHHSFMAVSPGQRRIYDSMAQWYLRPPPQQPAFTLLYKTASRARKYVASWRKNWNCSFSTLRVISIYRYSHSRASAEAGKRNRFQCLKDKQGL